MLSSAMKYSGISFFFAALLGVASVAVGQTPVYRYDAAADLDGDQYWQAQTTSTYQRDWNFGSATSPIGVTSAGTDFTQAYRFGAGGVGGATTGTFGREDNPLGGNEPAAFEFWIRPTDLTGEEVIFETGGHTSGLGLRLNDATLQSRSEYNNSASTHTQYDLPAHLANDFMQVVVVSDHQAGGEHHKLFVNGVPVSQNGDACGWQDGNDGAGLGRINNALGGYDGTGTFGNFNGDMSLVQFYADDLTDDQVWQNFVAHAGDYQIHGLTRTAGETLNYQPIDSNNISNNGATVVWHDTVDTIASNAADWSITNTKILPIHDLNYPEIRSALDFNGTSTGGLPVGNTGDGIALFGDDILGDAVSEQNATFEFWFHPDDVSNPGREQIIFESGGTGDGLALWLNGSELTFGVKSGNELAELTHEMDTNTDGQLDDVFGDFIQAVGVIDFDNDSVRLYIDGQEVDGEFGYLGVDWAGGNGSGLGRNNNGIYYGGSGDRWFDGQIAALRYYDWALSSEDVLRNYQFMRGITAIPEPSSGLLALLAVGLIGAAGYWRRRKRCG